MGPIKVLQKDVEVVIEIYDVVPGWYFSFKANPGNSVPYALLLQEKVLVGLQGMAAAARQQAYEEGFEDAKKRKPRKNKFSGILGCVGTCGWRE